MPDLGVPRGDARVAHLATPQWQSFEIRMRARKADRCLQRAAAALDDGSIDEASDALEEARQLSPLDPRLEELSARLDTLKHPAPPTSTAQGHGYFWTSAAIVAGLAVVGAAGWETWVHRDQIVLLLPKAHPDIDASAGLAAPAANDARQPNAPNANQAQTGETSIDSPGAQAAPTNDPTQTSQDTIVQTRLIRPEQVIDTREMPVGSRTPNETAAAVPPTETASVPTSGNVQQSDTKAEIERPLAVTTGQELSARPQRDTMPAPPPSPEYRTPAVLPATNPPPATSLVPPPSEPPRPTNAMATAAATNPATEMAVSSPAAAAPARSSTAPPPSPAPAPSPARDDRLAIRSALSRYESAYNRLDVDAVRSIWPSLDQRALARAFDNLTAQRVALQDCNVDVSGSTARANCSGNASWTPKVGGGERSASRKWTFDLSESNGAWRITHVQAR